MYACIIIVVVVVVIIINGLANTKLSTTLKSTHWFVSAKIPAVESGLY